MIRWMRGRLEDNRPILLNAASVVGTTGVNVGLGFVYWWLAARLFPPASIGAASAAISAIALLGTMGMLGMGTLLMGELPRRPERRGALISTSLIAASLGGATLGMLFVLLVPHTNSDLRLLANNGWSSGLLVLGAGLTAATLVLDQAFLGLLRGELQIWRNGLFGVVKLVLLALTGLWWAETGGPVIFGTWVGGLSVCLLTFATLARARGGALAPYRPDRRLLQGLGRAALGHHALNVTLQITGQSMPLVVTALLSTTTTAYFYTASMIASLVFVGPVSLATVLFAVGAAEPQAMARRLRFSLGLSAALGVIANLTLLVVGGRILGLFGHAYSQYATGALLIMSLSVFPLLIREHYAAVRRVQGRPVGGALLILAGSSLKLGMAAIGAHSAGLIGLTIGTLFASCIEAAVLAPTVARVALRTKGMRDLWLVP